MNQTPKHTPLYADLKAAGGRMVEFAGFELPVQFAGIKAEHRAVRTAAGLFDVSHMGRVWLEGPGALDLAHYLVTNDVKGLEDGQALYTPMCLENGGIIDDLLVYRLGEERVMLVINAANHDKDLAHVEGLAPKGVKVVDRSFTTGQLALQGPLAAELMARLASKEPAGLGFMRFSELPVAGRPCLVSRTGYTGEDGFEIYGDNEHMAPVFRELMKEGADLGLVPVGLGARDTLRLEARLCLYGNDIDETTTPLEAGLGWTVKLDAGDFLGREALARQKEEGVTRRLVGFEMMERGIARHGYPMVEADADAGAAPIGVVASGSPSPTLGKNIGLAYLPKKGYKPGAIFGVVIREKVLRAKVVKTPFYKKES